MSEAGGGGGLFCPPGGSGALFPRPLNPLPQPQPAQFLLFFYFFFIFFYYLFVEAFSSTSTSSSMTYSQAREDIINSIQIFFSFFLMMKYRGKNARVVFHLVIKNINNSLIRIDHKMQGFKHNNNNNLQTTYVYEE